ncbi:MotA/TolQ/ExbB proton channel family protein [Marinilabilia salmonicolor]|uniref:MotA/TolQ/ExbB proton channel family protein n=1 Tax=Marinilabilia salmonicolor TaxID=989 RepID=UPI000299EEFE|nr:MotA/TolQ/ExbB proton channel family protein [Marinilabilia salmonicolor]
MIFRHWYEGGALFMTLIFLMWVAVIALCIVFWRKRKKADRRTLVRLNEGILFTGSLAFLLGILGQVLGMFEALNVIGEMGDVSANMIAAGLRVSFIAPLYGFVLFILSGILWFVFRSLLKDK